MIQRGNEARLIWKVDELPPKEQSMVLQELIDYLGLVVLRADTSEGPVFHIKDLSAPGIDGN